MKVRGGAAGAEAAAGSGASEATSEVPVTVREKGRCPFAAFDDPPKRARGLGAGVGDEETVRAAPAGRSLTAVGVP